MKICIINHNNKKNDISKGHRTKSISAEAFKKGYSVDIIDSYDLVFSFDENSSLSISTIQGNSLLDYDAYIIYSVGIIEDKKANIEKVVIADYLIFHNKLVFNYSAVISSVYKSKLLDFYKMQKLGVPIIKTFYVEDHKDIESIKKIIKDNDYMFPLILKPINGTQGRDIYKVQNIDEIENLIISKKNKSFMIQEYIPIIHDLRTIVFSGEILGSIDKIPMNGDFRGNISQGAKAVEYKLSDELKAISLMVANSSGSVISGVDICISNNSYFILEVNDNPEFKGFANCLNINVPQIILNHLEKFQIN
jgi:RimK family alpha-L-glutamate ligase